MPILDGRHQISEYARNLLRDHRGWQVQQRHGAGVSAPSGP